MQTNYEGYYKKNYCEKCKNNFKDSNLQVHHKDYNRKNNYWNNLIILCKKCHLLKHNSICKKCKKLTKGAVAYYGTEIYICPKCNSNFIKYSLKFPNVTTPNKIKELYIQFINGGKK